jgi:Methyltransferase domain
MDRPLSMLKFLVKTLIRKKRPFIMGDMYRTEPVSNVFGLERGTPIDRYYIEKFISDHSRVIRGDALEIGELRYLVQYSSQLTTKNILAPNENAVSKSEHADNITIGDLTKAEVLPVACFDTFVCTQTLNFIYDVTSSIRGAYHLLKPGGCFIGTVSGISQISRYDMDRWGDYWRFTTLSLTRMLGDVFGGDVRVVNFGNALAAQFILQGVAVEDIPDSAVLDDQDDDYQVTIGFIAIKKTIKI